MHPEEMVSRYEGVLYARAMRLVRSRSDALDLLQDTYERALRGQATFQPGTNLRHWLMTIMYNLFLDRCRRQAREPRALCIDEHEVASPEADAPEPWETITDEQIHAALADLERPFREVYELRLLDNCSYDEIADRLTIPRSTVGTRLMRARRKLRETLLTDDDPRCGTGRRLPKPVATPRAVASTAT
ncbi:MAG TPA: RNA polymerase sigma factor [Polyangia bacterium]|nr:RNA polymerase sigma factor [Polyangia bacterium]